LQEGILLSKFLLEVVSMDSDPGGSTTLLLYKAKGLFFIAISPSVKIGEWQ